MGALLKPLIVLALIVLFVWAMVSGGIDPTDIATSMGRR